MTRKVTIISAPAGSGKTSLLRAWAGRPGQPGRLAVLQVQRDQQDAQQFWLALLGAVRQATGTDSGAEPPAATPDFNGQAMAGRVLSELAEARAGVTLVVDDLHELNSPEALAQLTRLLTSLPPQVHAILTTRHDVRLGLHQLRLAGELAEIRAADLRFSERETRELLDASGITLSEAGVALLHQRTEGWAAGLRLAAISLAGHPDPERFVAEFSGSDRTVAEYLLAEMLERQPPDVQDLLLRTSLPDRVNGELADLLTGRPGSERILLDLEDANAFVESLDPGRTWFRYHHLFADFLRLELRRTLPAQVPVLHAGQLTSFRLATQARLGQVGEARTSLAALDDSLASSGEISNARAVICLAEGNPDAALAAVHDVLDGTAPVIGYVTVVEANLLAALAHRELGDQRAAIAATESALALSEADRLVLPFAITGSLELLEAMPSHETAHAALVIDIAEAIRGSSVASDHEPSPAEIEQLSPSELRVLRYLPTNLSRPEIASELSVSVNTVNTHIRNIYAKLQAQDRSSAVRRARKMRLLSAGLNGLA